MNELQVECTQQCTMHDTIMMTLYNFNVERTTKTPNRLDHYDCNIECMMMNVDTDL